MIPYGLFPLGPPASHMPRFLQAMSPCASAMKRSARRDLASIPALQPPPAKPPANDTNRTEQNGWRHSNLRIRGYMGPTERSGTEWNRAPMFRKQQAAGSNPTAGSPPHSLSDTPSYGRAPFLVLLSPVSPALACWPMKATDVRSLRRQPDTEQINETEKQTP